MNEMLCIFFVNMQGKILIRKFQVSFTLRGQKRHLIFMNRYNILHVPDCKNEFYGFEVLTLKLLKYLLNKIYPEEITKLNLVHFLRINFQSSSQNCFYIFECNSQLQPYVVE